jgi:hypothetical protein
MSLFLSDQFKFVIEDWELSVVVLPAIDMYGALEL